MPEVMKNTRAKAFLIAGVTYYLKGEPQVVQVKLRIIE
jgi:hypothetical protein